MEIVAVISVIVLILVGYWVARIVADAMMEELAFRNEQDKPDEDEDFIAW